MKQNLIFFLGAYWMQNVDRIEDSYVTNNPAVDVYPACDLFSLGILKKLLKFADDNDYMYYIDVINGNVRMRIFKAVES